MGLSAKFDTREFGHVGRALSLAGKESKGILRRGVSDAGREARKTLVEKTNRLGSFEQSTIGVNAAVKGRAASGPSYRLTTTGPHRTMSAWLPGGSGERLGGADTIKSMRARGMVYNPPVTYRGAFHHEGSAERSFWQAPKGRQLLPLQREGSGRYPVKVLHGPNVAHVARAQSAFSAVERAFSQKFFDSSWEGISRTLSR